MRTNVANKMKAQTHEGGRANPHLTPYQELRRAVLACLLWEDQFYEDGKSIADRIAALANEVDPVKVSQLAIDARKKFNLRHVPLLLATQLASRKLDKPALIRETVHNVIQRPDELTELLSLYWKNGRKPIDNQLRKGLKSAFTKFSEYQLAKYNRDNAIKLRDVLFMTHAKPKDEEQAATWKKLVDGTLESPDTWEVALSAGSDKKETFTRLIKENKLGYLALLRNLRNMQESGVDRGIVKEALLNVNADRVLPFRYVAAARAVPAWADIIDKAFQKRLENLEGLPGKTTFLVDVSGSMDAALSSKSDLTRIDAAAALAAIWPGEKRVFTFSNILVEVPSFAGLAAIEAIKRSQDHGGTQLGGALSRLETLDKTDRLVVITDEQSHDSVGQPYAPHGYMLNVASYKPSIAYGNWVSITGFSENVMSFIKETELSE